MIPEHTAGTVLRVMAGFVLMVILIGFPMLSQPTEFRTNKVPVYIPDVVGNPEMGIVPGGNVVQGTSVKVAQSILYWFGEPVEPE